MPIQSHRPPVVLFSYRREQHLRRVLDALRRNAGAPETHLIAYSDGPRSTVDEPQVECVRKVLRAVDGFASVRIVERVGNFGLSRNILDGVTEAIDEHGAVIVLEDDLLTSPYFLDYMRDGLRRYADDERVASVHGFQLPLGVSLPETYFLPGADCWGWGTWRRAWAEFETNGTRLLAELEMRGLCNDFDLDGAYPYTQLLRETVAGRVDSWAVRWYASAYLHGRLTLYPGRSLVRNIGNDGSGEHRGVTSALDTDLCASPLSVHEIPVVPSPEIRASMGAALRRAARSGSLRERIARAIGARLRAAISAGPWSGPARGP